MFTKLIAIIVTLAGLPAFAAFAPGGPSIGLGCSNAGQCMTQVPLSSYANVISLSGGSLSYTTANYYTMHQDGPTVSASSYQVASSGPLVCFGWRYLANTTTTFVFGWGDNSVTDDSATGPTNRVCMEADAGSCAQANGSSFRVPVASTNWEYVPHIFSFPASKYPFVRLIGTNTFISQVQLDCYQN